MKKELGAMSKAELPPIKSYRILSSGGKHVVWCGTSEAAFYKEYEKRCAVLLAKEQQAKEAHARP
jgi:hypothetical protein